MKKILLFKIALLFLLTMSCSPEDGKDGVDGVDGIDGVDGVDGADGVDGSPGAANIIYSDWFPSEFPDNIDFSEDSFIVEAPDLTDEIMEKGMLLVFGRTFNAIDDALIEQLPRIVFFRDQYYRHRYISNPWNPEPQQFEIVVQSTDGGFIGTPFFDEYRYFILPGGIQAGGKSSVDYTKLSYEEVIEMFDIPE